MLNSSAADEEIDGVINSWGYTMNATDFMSGINNQRTSTATPPATRPMGRGRGRVGVSGVLGQLSQIRLAAHINTLEPHNTPMGHLPTTQETLSRDVGDEIQMALRTMGAHSGEGRLSRTTRPTEHRGEDVRIDGNVPVLLNGDFFHTRYRSVEDEASDDGAPVEPSLTYDPAVPLAEQFSTILEFQPQPSASTDSSGKSSKSSERSTARKKTKSSKAKKTKWSNVSLESIQDPPKPRGRYDTDTGPLRPPSAPNSSYRGRVLYGESGIKNL